MQISRNIDWNSAVKHLDAFWHHDYIDRPCLQVSAPASKSEQDAAPPWDVPKQEENRHPAAAEAYSFRANYMRTCHFGESLPVLYPQWEAVQMTLGCQIQQKSGTTWCHPAADSIVDLELDHLSVDHPEVSVLLEKLDYCAAYFKDEAFIGFPPLGNAGDTLARAIGYDNMCIDLIENPEEVIAAEKKMTAMWKAMFDATYSTVNRHLEGSCGWLPAWCPKRCALIEFDFGAMISPEMFQMYLPELIERADYADYSIYHLDGPDALKHLDTILAQKEFDAIQWEPGIACTDICQWIPLMQKIQAAGKGLYIASGRYSKEAVMEMLRNLRPEGLMIPLWLPSIQEAEEFMETAEKMFR